MTIKTFSKCLDSLDSIMYDGSVIDIILDNLEDMRSYIRKSSSKTIDNTERRHDVIEILGMVNLMLGKVSSGYEKKGFS